MESKLREQRHRAHDHNGDAHEVLKGALGGPALRVLLVDDNADDRALAARELRREIPNVQIVEAGDGTALRDALESGSFDALVTAEEERYKKLFETIPVALFKCSQSGQILEANPAFALLAGFSHPRELRGKRFSEL